MLISSANHPQKRNSKKIILYVVIVLIALLYVFIKSPFSSNSNAYDYLNTHYPKMIVRYNQMGTHDFLSLVIKTIKDKLSQELHEPFNKTELPSININIKFKSWENIKNQRNEMLGRIFMRDLQDYEKATIQINNKSIPVKIRLKGGRSDHINKPNRWSLRVKTRKDKVLFGMKVFSLQHPQTRGYQREAVFHEYARKQNLLALKYLYVNVSINGEYQGIMAIEEVPSKIMLEREGYKEGLIYQLDDINVRRMYHSVLNHHIQEDPNSEAVLSMASPDKMYNGHYSRIARIYYNALNAPIKEITRKRSGDNYDRQRPIAVGLFKALREGKITPSDVFDAEKTGLFYAYLALWGDTHNASFRNSRYYFNPYTLKFEPIVYDSNAYGSRHNQLYPYRSTFRDHELNRILLSDPLILNSYLSFVQHFLLLSEQDDFEESLRALETPHLSHLRNEFWLLPELNLRSMKESIAFIDSQITTKNLFKTEIETINDINDPQPLRIPDQFVIPKVIHVEFIDDNKLEQHLEIHNLFPLNAYVTELSMSINGQKVNINDYLNTDLPKIIKPFYYNRFYSLEKIKLKNLPKYEDIKISGKVKLESQNNISYDFQAQKSYSSTNQHPLKSDSISQILKKYPFISFDSHQQRLTIQSGTWQINEFIILPKHISLVIQAGTKLQFSEKAGLLIKGQLQLNGTQTDPIILDSLLGTKGSHWLGITVMSSPQPSKITYSVIKNTHFTQHNNWQLTGGVNFYQSDIMINNSQFINTLAEDAINIVKSQFVINNSIVNQTISDGLDTDFSEGSLSQLTFTNIGGDAVDFSGSKVSINNSYFSNVHDKAVSVGEESNVEATSLNINRSGTGLAVKDGSYCKITSSSFKNIIHSSMMSYTKKKTFGPSTLEVTNSTFKNSSKSLIAQGYNKLILNDVSVPSVNIDIEKFYKEGHMKK